MLYLIKAVPVSDLVKQLENGKRITEKSVIDDSECSYIQGHELSGLILSKWSTKPVMQI